MVFKNNQFCISLLFEVLRTCKIIIEIVINNELLMRKTYYVWLYKTYDSRGITTEYLTSFIGQICIIRWFIQLAV